MIKLLSFLMSIMLFCFCSLKAQAIDTDRFILSNKITSFNKFTTFKDSIYYHWCSSIIKDEKGKYHMFYSRWEKSKGFAGWLTHSEIAHAISDSPYGEYKYVATILKGRVGKWDAFAIHNPKIKYFDGKYYLYYLSTNSGDKSVSDQELIDIAKQGGHHKYWNLLRNNQRIGVAVSSNLNNFDWERSEKPLVEPHFPIGNVASNPNVVKAHDKYYMVVKGDDLLSDKWKLIQSIAISSKPDGEFEFQTKPIFNEISTEDVSLWYDERRSRFYALFHALGQNFIGMLTSQNGIDWEKAKDYVVCKKEFNINKYFIYKPERMERPNLFLDMNIPSVLSFGVKDKDEAYILLIPLKK